MQEGLQRIVAVEQRRFIVEPGRTLLHQEGARRRQRLITAQARRRGAPRVHLAVQQEIRRETGNTETERGEPERGSEPLGDVGGQTCQGAAGGGGIGLMDILLLGGIAYLVYWYITKKRREAAATAG